MLEIIGAIFGGGATGLLGSIINSVGDYFKMKAQNKHEEFMAKIETRHLEMEIKRDVTIAKQEATARMEVADAETQAASYEGDKRAYLPAEAVKSNTGIAWLMALVDFFRGLVRPVLTVYLSVVVYLIYMQTKEITDATVGGAMTPDQAYELMKTITLGLLYLTFTAVGWWFGSRSKFDKIAKL